MNKKSRGTIVVKVKQWGGGGIIGGVEQLGEVVVTIDDEWCFLVMLRMKDLQWSCKSRCDPKFNAILHIKMIISQIFYYRH
jgi:hypothetical protein